MTLCYCNSGSNFENCCGPLLDGAPVPTAEALLRSRYSAFFLGNLDYVERTHAPEIQADFNRAEAERAVSECEWRGLEILDASEDEDAGRVEFMIRFHRDGQDYYQHELATFRREAGRWVYVSSEINPKPPQRHVVKIGRNDPCSCGSGKKYKKCCGA
jgi:SEC-C motif-containing protein